MVRIAEVHCERNESTRDRWDAMASHRAQMMRHVLAAAGTSRDSLCVLGAGNANDIDLPQLAERFDRLALVDLDERALSRAIAALDSSARAKVELYGGCDVTAILPQLDSLPRSFEIADESLGQLIAAAECAVPPLHERFDVVLSACLLSQLIDSVCMAVSAQSAGGAALVMAVRNRHLEILVNLLQPGGRGILVTDFVATETAPELAAMPEGQIPAAAIQWINQRNFFTGTNPYAIRDHLQRLAGTDLAVSDIEVSPAWRWDIGAKQLAVSAITFQRNGVVRESG